MLRTRVFIDAGIHVTRGVWEVTVVREKAWIARLALGIHHLDLEAEALIQRQQVGIATQLDDRQ